MLYIIQYPLLSFDLVVQPGSKDCMWEDRVCIRCQMLVDKVYIPTGEGNSKEIVR